MPDITVNIEHKGNESQIHWLGSFCLRTAPVKSTAELNMLTQISKAIYCIIENKSYIPDDYVEEFFYIYISSVRYEFRDFLVANRGAEISVDHIVEDKLKVIMKIIVDVKGTLLFAIGRDIQLGDGKVHELAINEEICLKEFITFKKLNEAGVNIIELLKIMSFSKIEFYKKMISIMNCNIKIGDSIYVKYKFQGDVVMRTTFRGEKGVFGSTKACLDQELFEVESFLMIKNS